MPTLLCVPIMVSDAATALADAESARHAGADLVEFRVDAYVEATLEYGGDALRASLDLVAECALPSIVTCRPSWEGGHYEGSDAGRVELIEGLVASDRGPAYVDIELAAFSRTPDLAERLRSARSGANSHARLIVSIHDFAGRPADLTRRVIALEALGLADVAKIAFRARSLRDSLELFEIARDGQRPTIALGMGEFGLMSRILAPQCGAFLTFAALRDESATAPGQPTLTTLLSTYRIRSITRKTLVYGIIGWPVGHSISPLVHNAGFEAVDHAGVYVPLPIAADGDTAATYASFKATLLSLVNDTHLNFAGASVTLPHKEHLVALAREQRWVLDELSAACGAANTLWRDANGTWHVSNTDAPAAVDPLARALGTLADSQVIVLGAGGAARALAFELSRRGASVLIVNRSTEPAAALVRAMHEAGHDRARAVELEAVTRADAIINCTPVGMAGGPAPGDSPIAPEDLNRIGGLRIVQDTVYTPIGTSLLKEAERCGIRTIDGVEMFVGQAAAQFTRWTGRPAPTGLFERVAREALAR